MTLKSRLLRIVLKFTYGLWLFALIAITLTATVWLVALCYLLLLLQTLS